VSAVRAHVGCTSVDLKMLLQFEVWRSRIEDSRLRFEDHDFPKEFGC